MENTLNVRIILPSGVLIALDATIVIIPGSKGAFSVLPQHMKFISDMGIGLVEVHINSRVQKFFVYGGIAEVSTERLNIITEFAVSLDGLNKNIIIDKIKQLEVELKDKEKNSDETDIINGKINIHKSLLEFV